MGVGRALDVDRGARGQPRLLGWPRWEVGRSKQKRAGVAACGPGRGERGCHAVRGNRGKCALLTALLTVGLLGPVCCVSVRPGSCQVGPLGRSKEHARGATSLRGPLVGARNASRGSPGGWLGCEAGFAGLSVWREGAGPRRVGRCGRGRPRAELGWIAWGLGWVLVSSFFLLFYFLFFFKHHSNYFEFI